MNTNITYQVVKKEVQKKIINYLYLNNDITISEYEALISKCDNIIDILKEQLKKEKDYYKYAIKVNIRI